MFPALFHSRKWTASQNILRFDQIWTRCCCFLTTYHLSTSWLLVSWSQKTKKCHQMSKTYKSRRCRRQADLRTSQSKQLKGNTDIGHRQGVSMKSKVNTDKLGWWWQNLQFVGYNRPMIKCDFSQPMFQSRLKKNSLLSHCLSQSKTNACFSTNRNRQNTTSQFPNDDQTNRHFLFVKTDLPTAENPSATLVILTLASFRRKIRWRHVVYRAIVVEVQASIWLWISALGN